MKKNEGIEGLRGWAAMIVVMSHLILTIWPAMASGIEKDVRSRLDMAIFHSPLTIFYSGTFAVFVFFVMSGYVLSVKFFRTGDEQIIRDLFLKRYVRLMLPALCSTVLACLLVKLGFLIGPEQLSLSSWFTSYSPSHDLPAAIYEGFWRCFILGESNFNWALWTMRVELLGSLLTFSLCLLTKNTDKKWIIYLLVSLALLWILGPSALYYIAFIIGIWIAERPEFKLGWVSTTGLILATLLFGGFIPGSLTHAAASGFSMSINKTLIPRETICAAIGGIAVFIAVLGNKKFLDWFGRFSTLGNRSFAIYLLHLPVMASIGAASFQFSKEFFSNYNAAGAVMVITVIAVTYFLAGYYAKYIDQNSIKLAAYICRVFKKPSS